MERETSILSLVELGFTRLEAEIYTYLVQNPPATGYRIAQAIAKPAANVYKSLQTLESKGALLVDHSSNRLYRAVDPGELLDRMQKKFLEIKTQADSSLSTLKQIDDDDRIYQLRTRDQVFERAIDMLENGKEIIIVDAFPDPLEQLKPDIDAAIKRGVNVAVQAYQPVFIPGAEIFDCPNGDRFLRRWPGSWINIIKDGEEHIISFLDRKHQVVQAVWTSSPYLSWVYYSSLLSELQLTSLTNMIQNGADATELQELIDHYDEFFTLEASGYQRLRKRFEEHSPFPENVKLYNY